MTPESVCLLQLEAGEIIQSTQIGILEQIPSSVGSLGPSWLMWAE